MPSVRDEGMSRSGARRGSPGPTGRRPNPWQRRAKERQGGRLYHTERLRAQRWLTLERNELILASCLRIAQEMEGFTDVSKSTIRRPMDQPSKESEVRTEHATIDRSGTVARFLRLAFPPTSGYELSGISLWAWMETIDKNHRHDALVTGVINFFDDIGWTIGPVIAGILFSTVGPSWTIAAGGGLILAIWAISSVLIARTPVVPLRLLSPKPHKLRHKH